MNNQTEVTIKITRAQLIDLMLACTTAKKHCNDEGKKWDTLYEIREKIMDIAINIAYENKDFVCGQCIDTIQDICNILKDMLSPTQYEYFIDVLNDILTQDIIH